METFGTNTNVSTLPVAVLGMCCAQVFRGRQVYLYTPHVHIHTEVSLFLAHGLPLCSTAADIISVQDSQKER